MQISVVVTCYNAEATLADALASIVAQELPPYEVIIVDDGSDDGSIAIAQSTLPSATIIRQANQGVSAARNAGLASVSGTAIAFLDDDDIWHPAKLQRQAQILERYPQLDLIATSWSRSYPTPTEEQELRWLSYRELTLMNQFQTSTVLIRTDLVHKVGGFNSALDSVEDWAYWIACAKQGSLAILEQDLVLYRDSPDGVSKDLRRFWSKLMHMLNNTEALSLLDPTDRERITAWHTQRMAIAAILASELPLLPPILRHMLTTSPIAQAYAMRTLTLPFLKQRLQRRTARRPAT
ncbi:glycosyltransferase family 2 protein [Ferrimicrobium acidiphilum]|uniref:glycosyltransferase family 2 protein n=1 Tax=Ferrimicrobium acidiphilum TaxID=121039 RepID=UPI0023EF7DE8|nr:glycosyltransferase family A protein [Ferrimicrobium acidiphilum]